MTVVNGETEYYVDSLDSEEFDAESIQGITNQLEISFISFVSNLMSLSRVERWSGKAKRAENEFIGLGSIGLIKDAAAVANVRVQIIWAISSSHNDSSDYYRTSCQSSTRSGRSWQNLDRVRQRRRR
jgi:hypothetical protein